MFFKIKLVLLVLLFCVRPACASDSVWANSQSEYTSTDDCKEMSSEPYSLNDCPAKAPYKLYVGAADVVDISLEYEDKTVTSGYGMPRHIGSVVEWRFHEKSGQKKYHALIYRLFSVGEKSKTPYDRYVQKLIVFRLDKSNSCMLGVIKQGKNMNIKAREVADNKLAECIGSDR